MRKHRGAHSDEVGMLLRVRLRSALCLLLPCAACTCATQWHVMSAGECSALSEFHSNATMAASWLRSRGWRDCLFSCLWEGVTCDECGYVSSLRCARTPRA